MENAVRKGDHNALNNFVSNFAPKTAIEQNYWNLGNIYLNTYFKKVDTLTANQYAVLKDIANQCPLSGGRVVFEARASLNGYLNTNILYDDSACYGGSNQSHRNVQKPVTSTVNRNALVYPNPASTMLNIQVSLAKNQTDNVCLYNAVGEKVLCLELKNDLTTVSISNFPSGIYFYRITDNIGNLIKGDKVMIVH